MSSLIPYQQLFEIDEVFVEILRHLFNDARYWIYQLASTTKWLLKRLHSTALWKNLGIVFYRHNENIITTKMLWYMLQERQIELDLPHLKHLVSYENEDTEALNYLINLSRSDSEESRMLNHEFLQSPLYDVCRWHENPEHKRLVCVLLSKLFKNPNTKNHEIGRQYTPVFVEIIKNHQEQLESPLALAAFKALRALLIEMRIDRDTCDELYQLGPMITKLMTHDNEKLKKMGFRIARVITRGSNNPVMNLPGYWPAISDGLSSKKTSIRKDTALSLSALVMDNEIQRTHFTEEIFMKLLALASDSLNISYEVMIILNNAVEFKFGNLSEAQKQMWHDHFEDILDFHEKRINACVKAKDEKDFLISAQNTADSLLWLIETVDGLPNNQTLRQKSLQSSVVQLVRTLDLPNYIRKKIDAL